MSRETRGMLLGLVAVAMFAMTLPMTRLAVAQLDPVWLALARAEGAALLAGLVVFGLSKALKLWAITTLAERWSFRVLVLPGRPLIATGPYRWLRHPNYLAVIGEILGVALIVWAIVTGPLAVIGFGALLRSRIAVEERALGRQ